MKKYLLHSVAFLVASTSGLEAQATAKPDLTVIRNFPLRNVSTTNEALELMTGVRVMLPPETRVYLDPSRNIISVRATPEVLGEAEKLINELDRPKKAYLITYTVTESDGGKRIGNQHFSLATASGARTTLKQGSKIPIITGSYDQGKSGAETQFTYLDIGLNFDTTVEDMAGGASLKVKLEQSSIAPEPSGVGTDPIVRQSVLESSAVVAFGKPLVVGSLDVPGSTRHLDIEVVVEPQK